MNETEQTARVRKYEAVLDEASALLRSGDRSAAAAARLFRLMRKLEAYYTGPCWKQDYADDEAGLLPKDLKRGVLSQDGVYDLLQTYEEWKEEAGAPAVLETKRLILRPWTEEDAEECFRYAKDPLVGPAAGWPAHTCVEETGRIIRDVLSAPETYAVVWKKTGLPVGCVGLNFGTAAAPQQDEAELGYWLEAPWWGRGIMPEAARALLRRAFEELGLNRVWCGYFDGNSKSKRVQQKLGFRWHHTVENVDVPQLGETRTEHVCCLTREDWLSPEE